jgi:hypothetical protein
MGRTFKTHEIKGDYLEKLGVDGRIVFKQKYGVKT